jgi:predicted ATPase
MKLLQLEIEGFRSLKSQDWHPSPGLNVLIGRNGAGKTNLLKVFELLGLSARGQLGAFVQREGGMHPLVYDGGDDLHLRAKFSPPPPYENDETDALTYDLHLVRLGTTSAYRIEHETLGNYCAVDRGEATEAYKLLERDTQRGVVYSIDKQRFEFGIEDSISEGETLLSVAAGPFTHNRFIELVKKELTAWAVYEGFRTDRKSDVRSPAVARSETYLAHDGQNLATVLHTAYNSRSREFREQIQAAVQAVFGSDFVEFIFPSPADQRIEVRVRWKDLEHTHSTADLSDGTLRFLMLVAVLANPNPPPLIAIDQPETGLHPAMLRVVAALAAQAAERTQVILTTHSSEFLDAFDEVPCTTIVEWEDAQTHLHVLSGESLEYWLEEYSLGQLFRSRQLEAMT